VHRGACTPRPGRGHLKLKKGQTERKDTSWEKVKLTPSMGGESVKEVYEPINSNWVQPMSPGKGGEEDPVQRQDLGSTLPTAGKPVPKPDGGKKSQRGGSIINDHGSIVRLEKGGGFVDKGSVGVAKGVFLKPSWSSHIKKKWGTALREPGEMLGGKQGT